jgi:hypothetical protein
VEKNLHDSFNPWGIYATTKNGNQSACHKKKGDFDEKFISHVQSLNSTDKNLIVFWCGVWKHRG